MLELYISLIMKVELAIGEEVIEVNLGSSQLLIKFKSNQKDTIFNIKSVKKD